MRGSIEVSSAHRYRRPSGRVNRFRWQDSLRIYTKRQLAPVCITQEAIKNIAKIPSEYIQITAAVQHALTKKTGNNGANGWTIVAQCLLFRVLVFLEFLWWLTCLLNIVNPISQAAWWRIPVPIYGRQKSVA